MKILYVITKSNWGGAQRYVFDLAEEMKRRGHQVSVAAGGDGLLRKKLAEAHIPTHKISGMGRDMHFFTTDTVGFFSLLRILAQERPDVLHVNSSKIGGVGAFLGRLLVIRTIVFTAHGWPSNENRGALARRVIGFFSWLTVFLSHKTIVISAADFAQASHWPLIKNKLLLIRNGITPVEFLPQKTARETLGLPQEGLVIGTIGELHRNKNQRALIAAADSLKEAGVNFTLNIIGEGEERPAIEKMIAGTPRQSPPVILSGFIENASRYLKAYDIFVLPSEKEGLPYVILEAGHAGIATIASSVGGIPDIITEKETGLLAGPNTQKLASAMGLLLADSELRIRLGEALKRKVIKEFSLEKMVSETEKAYR